MHRTVRAASAVVTTTLVASGLTWVSAVALQAAAEPPSDTDRAAAQALPTLPSLPVPTITLPSLPLPTITLPTLPTELPTLPTDLPTLPTGSATATATSTPSGTASPTSSTSPTTDPGDLVLQLLSGLGLPASAEVGQLIALTDPVWSLPGVTTSYQWLRDGVPIPGADGQTYVPTLDDAGHALSAQATGALAGVPLLNVVTASLGIPLVTQPALTPTSDITVTGTKKIGTALTLSGPSWDADGATNKYQWLRDDAPISGATAASYVLAAADYGHAITVKATGHQDGYTDNTITSDPVQPVIGDAITFVAKPRVTGTPKVGKLLTADPGQWTGGTEGSGQPVYTYQWTRAGEAIAGQVAQTYQVTKADIGRAITVTITATRPAYKMGRFTTAALTVDKVTSTVTASLAHPSVKQGKAALMKVLVKAGSGVKPAGKVTVYDGKKKLKTVSAQQAAKGISLTGLKAGTHQLHAVYAGSSTVAGATSKTVKLTVTKAKKTTKK